MRKLVFVFVMAAVVWATPTAAVADEKPSDRNLVLAGMAMALPTYFLELSVHEGSHALMAKAMGAELVAFSLVPPSILAIQRCADCEPIGSGRCF